MWKAGGMVVQRLALSSQNKKWSGLNFVGFLKKFYYVFVDTFWILQIPSTVHWHVFCGRQTSDPELTLSVNGCSIC